MEHVLLDGRYRPQRRLGAGGMGEVWLAHDERLDRYVAIKRVLLDGRTAEDEAMIRLMRREAIIAGNLNHPHIVTIHDLLEVGGHPYLVMEHIDGESMSDRLRHPPAMTPLHSARLVAQAASGLTAAHRNGVVHRDIKPHNILIDHEGSAKVADFGIARAIETMVTRGGGPTGTFAYMAPEVARAGRATPASDVWSLGATFFDATEGHPPHLPPEVQHLGDLFQRILTRDAPRPARAGPFAPLITAMLATDPGRRPPMAAVATEIGRIRRGQAAKAAGPPPPDPPERPERPERPPPDDDRRGPVDTERPGGRRRTVAILLAVVVLVAVVAVVAVVVSTADDDGGEGGTPVAAASPSDGVTNFVFKPPDEIVRLSGAGFDPAELTLTVGDAVMFQVTDAGSFRLTVADLPYGIITGEQSLYYEFTKAGHYLVLLDETEELAVVVE